MTLIYQGVTETNLTHFTKTGQMLYAMHTFCKHLMPTNAHLTI